MLTDFFTVTGWWVVTLGLARDGSITHAPRRGNVVQVRGRNRCKDLLLPLSTPCYLDGFRGAEKTGVRGLRCIAR
jgi:hypothetical protein